MHTSVRLGAMSGTDKAVHLQSSEKGKNGQLRP